MSQTLPPPLFDPFAPGFTDDPYPQYAALRAAAPVYHHPFGFWLLTCYDEVSWSPSPIQRSPRPSRPRTASSPR
jgi:cytochrome P450